MSYFTRGKEENEEEKNNQNFHTNYIYDNGIVFIIFFSLPPPDKNRVRLDTLGVREGNSGFCVRCVVRFM